VTSLRSKLGERRSALLQAAREVREKKRKETWEGKGIERREEVIAVWCPIF
jgi:hypothetical protein